MNDQESEATDCHVHLINSNNLVEGVTSFKPVDLLLSSDNSSIEMNILDSSNKLVCKIILFYNLVIHEPTNDNAEKKFSCDMPPDLDLFHHQLHGLFKSYKSLERSFTNISDILCTEYDFIQYSAGRTAAISNDSKCSDLSDDSLTNIEGHSSVIENNDTYNTQKIIYNSMDGITMKLELLIKQYTFARQRELEKYNFEKKLDEVI